jgi:hypothetical protein
MSPNGGLTTSSTGVSLKNCTNGQVLKATSVTNGWDCGDDRTYDPNFLTKTIRLAGSSGSAQFRRTGNVVTMYINTIVPAYNFCAGTNILASTIPAGFKPDFTMWWPYFSYPGSGMIFHGSISSAGTVNLGSFYPIYSAPYGTSYPWDCNYGAAINTPNAYMNANVVYATSSAMPTDHD